jgi:hypothetical protein
VGNTWVKPIGKTTGKPIGKPYEPGDFITNWGWNVEKIAGL